MTEELLQEYYQIAATVYLSSCLAVITTGTTFILLTTWYWFAKNK